MRGDGIKGKAEWQFNIDKRVQAGRNLGSGFASDLTTKYGISISDIQKYAEANKYQLSKDIAGSSSSSSSSSSAFPTPDQTRFTLQKYQDKYAADFAKQHGYSLTPGKGLSIVNQLDYTLGGWTGSASMDRDRGGGTTYFYGTTPTTGKPTNTSGLNIRGDGIKGDGIKGDGIPGRPGMPSYGGGSYGGGGGMGGGGGGDVSPVDPAPALAAPNTFRPGGPGSFMSESATGFRRRRSSSRMAGLTNKGTSQFKIGGQTARSSGLNIGV
jgi:hypothetical protein